MSNNPEPLRLPRGVRFPRRNEIPSNPSDVLNMIAKAQLTTGYIVHEPEDGSRFDAYIEANVHATNIFDVFRKLSFALMPAAAAPIIGLEEEEPVFGPYTFTETAVAVFEPHADLLQNDGFLEFGITHQSDTTFEEIFVAAPKYFKIWTKNLSVAEEVFQSNGIPKCVELQFIDEFPMVSSSSGKNGNAAYAGTFYAIQEQFEKLTPYQPIKDETNHS